MIRRHILAGGMLVMALSLAGCGGVGDDAEPATTAGEATAGMAPGEADVATVETLEPTVDSAGETTVEAAASEEAEPATEPAGDVVTDPLAPRRLEFESEDDVPLVGTFYPPSVDDAAGVVLLHQYGATKEAWDPVIEPLREARPDLAYLAIDFPGHGESGGERSNESILAAARSALAAIGEQPQVDPARIVLIGASIGADAAVDACLEGCVGAVSISPGDWLGIPYVDALRGLNQEVSPAVLCMASEGDDPSPETCHAGEDVGLSDYIVAIYDGDRHGNSLARATWVTPEPVPIDLMIEWLEARLPQLP